MAIPYGEALDILLRNLGPLGVQVEGKTYEEIMAQCGPDIERKLSARIKSGEHGPWERYALHAQQVQS